MINKNFLLKNYYLNFLYILYFVQQLKFLKINTKSKNLYNI